MSETDKQVEALQKQVLELERQNRLKSEAIRQAGRIRSQWTEAMDTLKRTSRELEAANTELAILHDVATAVSETMELDELLERTLAIMGDMLDTPSNCGIFLVSGKEMKLEASCAGSQAFIDAHEGMRVGDCLCGQVAEHGEMIVSECGVDDARHTIRYPGFKPHGHLILPLRSKGQVVGVFFYYLPQGAPIPRRKLNLFQAIAGQIGIAIENASHFQKARQDSLHDALTGLANRRFMEMQLRHEVAASRRSNSPLSVIMLDLDRFKKYNDTYGHPAGDLLLIKIAEEIRHCLREEDLPARYGGEEFLVVLRNTTLQRATEVAERLRTRIEQQAEITVSLGVATLEASDDEPGHTVERADRALYRAKQTGRNRVCTQDDLARP